MKPKTYFRLDQPIFTDNTGKMDLDMHYNRGKIIVLAGSFAISSVALATLPLSAIHAQEVFAGQDPPSRVGRVARLIGIVSFRSGDQEAWDSASLNYPIISGNAFWTEPAALAEIDIGTVHVALDQATEFDIGTLDDRQLAATTVQGAIYLRIGALETGELFRFTKPRGVVTIARPGSYEIVAGDTTRPTTVTVMAGSADIDIGTTSLTVASGQTVQVTGTEGFRASVGPVQSDPFLTARLAAERQVVVANPRNAPRPVAPPQVVVQMTGGDALMSTGTWATSNQYDRIWYPPVEPGWVPYRHGHWGYVAPWGWTWIDDAAWGFAPFHYGRWVQEGRRWGWVPTQQGVAVSATIRPTYAPALVSFIGLSVDIAIGGQSRGPQGRPDPDGSVGWIPLGHELINS